MLHVVRCVWPVAIANPCSRPTPIVSATPPKPSRIPRVQSPPLPHPQAASRNQLDSLAREDWADWKQRELHRLYANCRAGLSVSELEGRAGITALEVQVRVRVVQHAQVETQHISEQEAATLSETGERKSLLGMECEARQAQSALASLPLEYYRYPHCCHFSHWPHCPHPATNSTRPTPTVPGDGDSGNRA